jgi:hypothetical protein
VKAAPISNAIAPRQLSTSMESSKTQNQTAGIVQDCNNISHKIEKSSIGDRFIVRNL